MFKAKLLVSVCMLLMGLTLSGPPAIHAAVSNWQKGFSIVPKNTTDYSSQNFKQSLSSLRSTGANYVTLIIPYYQSNIYSTDLNRGWNTPTDTSLVDAINYAHSIGLQVNLKMHPENYTGDWRAWIDPPDRNTWFNNYSAILNHYGDLAKQTGAEEITIGAELYKLTSPKINSSNTSHWDTLIDSLRGHYNGLLTYSANDDSPAEVNEVAFWDKLDSIGIAAYFALSSSNLAQSWDGWNNSVIAPLNNRWGKPILFTEVGYRSIDGAAWDAWNSDRGGNYNPTEQSNDYQALLSYWDQKPYMIGVQWWDWSSDPNGGGQGNIDYTPQNKPAQNVLTQWYGGSSTPNAVTTSNNSPPPVVLNPPASVDVSANTTPLAPALNQAAQSTITLHPNGGTLSQIILDVEVYNPASQRIFQHFFENQTIASGISQNFVINWSAASAGDYTIKVGIFNANWSSMYAWYDHVSVVTVPSAVLTSQNNLPPASTPAPQTPQSTPAPVSSASYSINLWWPSAGAAVSGTQPFKFNINGLDISQYDAFWQVDGGNMNGMGDNQNDYPHKESDVDVNPWTWHGNGPYTLNFIAKDKSGSVIAQKSVDITISR